MSKRGEWVFQASGDKLHTACVNKGNYYEDKQHHCQDKLEGLDPSSPVAQRLLMVIEGNRITAKSYYDWALCFRSHPMEHVYFLDHEDYVYFFGPGRSDGKDSD
jgi:hypothetical protein